MAISNSYQYQILRFISNPISQEFVNLGLVLYSRQNRFLKFYAVKNVSRLHSFFPQVNSKHIQLILKELETQVTAMASRLASELFDFEDLENLTSQLLPPDDSSLQFSSAKSGQTQDVQKMFDFVKSELFLKYEKDQVQKSISDKDVWTKIYKKHFDAFSISKKLTEHVVKTENEEFKFELSFKNHKQHLLMPLSFDLISESNVRDKIHKLTGQIVELESATEEIKLYLLSKFPTHGNILLDKSVLTKRLNKVAGNDKFEIIDEQDATQFAQRFSNIIVDHESEKS